MSEAKFRSRPQASGDDGFTIDISEDGQALTLSFAEIQVEVDAGKSPEMVAARVFSLVLPMDGAGNDVDISFVTSGYAFVSEGASGYAVLSVNGKTSVEWFPPGTDQDFVQELRLEAGPTCECQLSVVVLVQRDPASPDAVATIRPSTVDAEIHPRSVGKFVLKQDPTGQYHFNLEGPNGEVIATSEGYESKESARNGIESVQRNAPDAEVDDQTSS
jgi:uncharacterized protein YegP (UPF0339 family)